MRATLIAALAAAAATPAAAERITVAGEPIDTWCYFSGVMGLPESVTGTSHHTCALWCAAGGVPVGLLAEDGKVYFVLKIEGDDATNGGDRFLEIASHGLTATGDHFQRDGLDYIVVTEVVTDAGIVNLSHEEWGFIPDFGPQPPKE